jgi:hypothetical protein
MVAIQCLLMQGTAGFRDPLLAGLGALGALAVEGMAWALRPEDGCRWRPVTFAGLAPPLFWGIYLAGIAIRDRGLGWAVEVWSGALIWSGLTLLALALAMSLGAARGSETRVDPSVPESG